MTTTYVAREGYFDSEDNFGVYIETPGEFTQQLDPRFDLARHSLDGYAWGYDGSGPAQLSLALLAHVLKDDKEALRLYQWFKRRVINKLDQKSGWKLTRDEILATVFELQADHPKRPEEIEPIEVEKNYDF